MTNKLLRRYEMLFRVMTFGAARQDRFPDIKPPEGAPEAAEAGGAGA